jgi:putative ABC transport system ATP-binding protein
MNEPALVFDDVTRSYELADGRVFFALREVSFRAAAGRAIAIVGRSGSGKSTLLHLAAAIDVPSRGQVFVRGRDLARLTDGERARLRREEVGLVFQFFHLLPGLTVRENVALPGWIAGRKGRDLAARIDELLGRVGLGDRADQPVRKLSGGEMQRVAICRALLARPALLLADEPTGNLDDENARVVMELLLRLARDEGSTLVYVTHSEEMAGRADEVWSLHSGRLETVPGTAAGTAPPLAEPGTATGPATGPAPSA